MYWPYAFQADKQISYVIPQFAMLIAELNSLYPSLTMTSCKTFLVELKIALKAKFVPWAGAELIALFLLPNAHCGLKESLNSICEETYDDLGITSLIAEGRILVVEWIEKNAVPPTDTVPTSPMALLNNPRSTDLFNFTRATPVGVTSVEKELATYLALCYMPAESLSDFWLKYGGKVPNLSRLARYVYSIPASPASSEQTFSQLRPVLTDFRGYFHSSTINKILVVKDYINHLYFSEQVDIGMDESGDETVSEAVVDILGDGERVDDADWNPKVGTFENLNESVLDDGLGVDENEVRNVAPMTDPASTPGASSRSLRYGTRGTNSYLLVELSYSGTEPRFFATFKHLPPNSIASWKRFVTVIGVKAPSFELVEVVSGATICLRLSEGALKYSADPEALLKRLQSPILLEPKMTAVGLN